MFICFGRFKMYQPLVFKNLVVGCQLHWALAGVQAKWQKAVLLVGAEFRQDVVVQSTHLARRATLGTPCVTRRTPCSWNTGRMGRVACSSAHKPQACTCTQVINSLKHWPLLITGCTVGSSLK